MKTTPKQKLIIRRMQEGWILIIGQNESSGRCFYLVTVGYEHVYFNATVFSNLLNKGIIYQQQISPFSYILTELGKTI